RVSRKGDRILPSRRNSRQSTFVRVARPPVRLAELLPRRQQPRSARIVRVRAERGWTNGDPWRRGRVLRPNRPPTHSRLDALQRHSPVALRDHESRLSRSLRSRPDPRDRATERRAVGAGHRATDDGAVQPEPRTPAGEVDERERHVYRDSWLPSAPLA